MSTQEPAERLAQYVATLGRGPTRSRALEQHECEDAFSIILSGHAQDVQIGAFFALMRYRGESPAELAGLVQATRTFCGALPVGNGSAVFDWPSYAAGRTRGAPWFLLAAKLVARAGYPVLLHGLDSRWRQGISTRDAALSLAIPTAASLDEAQRLLADQNLVYLDMSTALPRLAKLSNLRADLGLRSPVNSLARLLNPLGATAGIVGVFHPSYRDLHRAAAARLGFENLSVWKGGGGEAEINPAKATSVFRLVSSEPADLELPAATFATSDEGLAGDISHLRHGFSGAPVSATAAACVITTCAAALATIRRAQGPAAIQDCIDEARQLWERRSSYDALRTTGSCSRHGV